MNQRTLAALMLVLISSTLVGCGSLFREPPAIVRKLDKVFEYLPDADWTLIDNKGKPLHWSQSSWVLDQADVFRYRDSSFETPHHRFTDTSAKLEGRFKPILGGSPIKLCGESAVALQDGKILISGGSVCGQRPAALNQTWIFDTKSGATAAGPNMYFARHSHCATVLHDGRVLITGGENSGTVLRSAELYDPLKNSFSEEGDMCVPRAEHAVVQLKDNRVLIVSGKSANEFGEDDDNLTSTVEVLNLATKDFKLMGRLDPPRYDPILVPYQQGAIVAGGYHSNSTGSIRWIRDAEIIHDLKAEHAVRQ